jgi:hypothetical protein
MARRPGAVALDRDLRPRGTHRGRVAAFRRDPMLRRRQEQDPGEQANA